MSGDSDLQWVREESPVWDADKQRVIGSAPEGAFVLNVQAGAPLPGDWWSVRTGDSSIVGYGRLDTTWGGDAEVLLAVAPDQQERGVGSFILFQLEQEAAAREINYIHNRIREHESRDFVHDWLVVRGFKGSVDGDLRKRVRIRDLPVRPVRDRPTAQVYDVTEDPADRAPGREDQGGYVSVDEHQY